MNRLFVRQPVLGSVATVLCIVLALAIRGLFDPLTTLQRVNESIAARFAVVFIRAARGPQSQGD